MNYAINYSSTRITLLLVLFVLMLMFGLLTIIHAQSPTLDDIDEMQAAWEDLEFEHYLLRFRYISVWNTYEVQARVESGFVEDVRMRCMPGLILDTCRLPDLQTNELDMSILFDFARESLRTDNDQWASITFDENYHYPQSVGYDDPDILDEDWGIEVTLFEPIAPSDGTPIFGWRIDEDDAESDLSDETVLLEFDDMRDQWIDDAEADWEALEISDYELAIHWGSVWAGATVHLRVTDGYVTDFVATCEPGWMGAPPDESESCWLPAFVPDEFSVPGLFEQARMIADMPEEDFNPIIFDATYFFPTTIVYDEEMLADEEWAIEVRAFTISDEPN